MQLNKTQQHFTTTPTAIAIEKLFNFTIVLFVYSNVYSRPGEYIHNARVRPGDVQSRIGDEQQRLVDNVAVGGQQSGHLYPQKRVARDAVVGARQHHSASLPRLVVW